MKIVEPPGGMFNVVFIIAAIVSFGFTTAFRGLGGVPINDPMNFGVVSIAFVPIVVVGLAGSYMGKNGPDAGTVDRTETAGSPA